MNLKELCKVIIPDMTYIGPENLFNPYCCAIP